MLLSLLPIPICNIVYRYLYNEVLKQYINSHMNSSYKNYDYRVLREVDDANLCDRVKEDSISGFYGRLWKCFRKTFRNNTSFTYQTYTLPFWNRDQDYRK